MERLEERGTIFFKHKGVFYNPFMSLSRELSSLVVSSIKDKLLVLDAFSASGIRGIMYKKANKKAEVDFLDYSEKATESIKRNLKFHRIEGDIIKEEFNKYLLTTEKTYNFIELDPFGSPNPYLYNSLLHLSKNKISYISATSTDLQVLCGVQKKACLKHYQSKSNNYYFCHELGLRILMKKIITISSEFNLYAIPLMSFYYRHQFKTIIKFIRNEKRAYEQLQKFKHIDFDENRSYFKLSFCCDKKSLGPLWEGELHNKDILVGIKKKEISKEAEKMVSVFISENDFQPYFYSTHYIARITKKNPIKIEKLENLFKENGLSFSKTHFSPEGFKSNEKSEEVLKLIEEI